PVTQLEPFPVEEEYPAEVAGVAMGSYLEWMRSCSRISATGCPAISIPAGLSAAGLPVGLQLVARPFAERALLEVAHAVDTQTGYSLRVPPAARPPSRRPRWARRLRSSSAATPSAASARTPARSRRRRCARPPSTSPGS